MKVNEWGVFIERPDNSTSEIILNEELSRQLYEYIKNLEEKDDKILSNDTKGKILW